MKRGDIVVAALPGAYGKPRPAVVVQSNILAAQLGSMVVCPITSDRQLTADFRINLEPSAATGLRLPSHIMVDKILALPTEKISRIIGRLEPTQLRELNRALMLVLDLP